MDDIHLDGILYWGVSKIVRLLGMREGRKLVGPTTYQARYNCRRKRKRKNKNKNNNISRFNLAFTKPR